MIKIFRRKDLVKKVREGEETFTREELEAAENRINKTMREFRKREIRGIIVEKSDCCQAPINYTGGGVRIPYCSKCGKYYEERRYR